MKKLRLLLAFCALLIGWSNASARQDVTSTYLTDAELANEAANWALVSTGGNHAWNGTYKYHESWHNTFTLTQTTAALPAGYYQLSVQAAVEGGNSTTISLQATTATNASVPVYPKYSTAGSYSDMAAWWGLDANHTGNKDLNRIFTTVYVEEGQTLTATFKQTDGAQWFVYGQIQLHKLTDEEGRRAQYFEAAYNPQTNLDMATGRFKQRFEHYTPGDVSSLTGKTLKKTISSLPNGKYSVKLNGGASYAQNGGVSGGGTGDDKTEFFANNVSTNVTVVARTNIGNEEFTDYSVSNVLVTDGNLEIGFNNKTSGANWFVGSVKYIEYLGGCVEADAVALPDGGAMAADTWYYFDIAVAGDDYAATATTLGDITCTTDGTQLSSSATGEVTLEAENNSLSATRYYVKSSSAQSLVVEAASYSYSISEASVNITEIQPGNTVTVSFIASTNDPSATLDQNYSGVRFNGAAISVTPTASGFTFTVPTVAANTEYTLVIPAGAIGYDEGSTYNAAQEITLNTPALLDGTYYLYDATSGLFLSSGADYGSRANVDAYGKPIIWNNSTKMLAFKNSTGVNFFFDNADHTNCWIYTDGNSSRGDNRKFEFVSNGAGKYYLQDFAKAVYLKHDNSVINVPVTNAAEATTWTVLSKAERDAIVAAYPAANKTSVITAAGLSGSTDAAGFETYLSENYVAKDQTSKVGTAKFAGSRGDWTWNQSRARDGQPAYGTDFCEIYEATGNFSQTISGLDEGIYKVTVNAFERSAGWSVCNDNGAEGYEIVTSYFAANDEKVLLKSWYSQKEGENNPNNTTQAATAFNNDKYKNEVYVYVHASGKLTLKLAKPTYVASSWVLFNNVTLTYYSSTMDPSDVTDLLDKAEEYLEKPMLATLKSAISTAKSALESVSSVANYNALNTALDNSETSIASYANMKTNYIDYIASIKENTNFYSADANTVYENNVTAYNNGTITNADANALATTISRYDSPAQNFLMPVWKIGETAATTAESGFYQNTWSGEGASDGSGFLTPFFEYWVSSGNVLPATTLTGTLAGLTPNASYKVEAWVRVQTTDGQTMADNGVTMKVGTGTPVDVTKGSRIGETTRYIKEYVAYGNADASGNLVVTFTVAASSNVSWLAFKNVNYSTVVPVTITAAGYATFSSAYALDLTTANTPTGLEAYYVGSEDVKETYVSLTAINQTVAANQGILFKGAPGDYNVTVAESGTALTGNQLVATDGNEVAAGNFVFAYENGTFANPGFYTLTAPTAVAAGKAYLQKPVSSVKAFLPFDGTATGVEAPEVTEAEEEEEILYNTAGVRVGKDYKGIVINQKGEKRLQK